VGESDERWVRDERKRPRVGRGGRWEDRRRARRGADFPREKAQWATSGPRSSKQGAKENVIRMADVSKHGGHVVIIKSLKKEVVWRSIQQRREVIKAFGGKSASNSGAGLARQKAKNLGWWGRSNGGEVHSEG